MPLSHPDFSQVKSPAGERAASPERILVVDDEKTIRELFCAFLTDTGYRVATAPDGELGWNALDSARHSDDSFDLLLTDHNMPKVTGVELVQMVRSAGITIPIILVSSAVPEFRETLQVSAILEKPVSQDELVRTVRATLEMATSATPRLKLLARRLLEGETKLDSSLRRESSLVFSGCERLRERLSKLLGPAGYHSIISRAVALASSEVSALGGLQVSAAGTIQSAPILGELSLLSLLAGEVIILAQLLGLLTTFIGPGLTLQMVREAWPELDNLAF